MDGPPEVGVAVLRGLWRRRIERVEALEPEAGAREPKWTQTGDALELDVDAKAFGYRLVFSDK